MATGQGQGDKFKIPDDQAAKIKAALPAKTPAPVQKKHEVLVFSKTAGFRHSSIAAGVYCMKALGEKTGLFNVTHTEDEAWFAPDKLKAFADSLGGENTPESEGFFERAKRFFK